MTFVRNRDLSSFEQIFEADYTDNKLVHCVDVDRLFAALDYKHCSQDWRLFLDGSCKSTYSIRYEYKRTKLRHRYEINFLITNIIGLKAVLLHNEKSVAIGSSSIRY